MTIFKLILTFIAFFLFDNYRNLNEVDNKLQLAWDEINSDKDIFEKYDQINEYAFLRFENNAPDSELTMLDLKISLEEQRIKRIQTLIEEASPRQISLLIK